MDKERKMFEKWMNGAESVSDYIRQAMWAGWKKRASLDALHGPAPDILEGKSSEEYVSNLREEWE